MEYSERLSSTFKTKEHKKEQVWRKEKFLWYRSDRKAIILSNERTSIWIFLNVVSTTSQTLQMNLSTFVNVVIENSCTVWAIISSNGVWILLVLMYD